MKRWLAVVFSLALLAGTITAQGKHGKADYDMNGQCLAHGGNPKMVGKELIDLKDADGKAFPVTKKIEDKTA